MTKKSSSKKQLITTLREVGEIFRQCSKKSKILPVLSWKPEVAQEFFRKKESELPKPTYVVDKKAQTEVIEALKAVKPRLEGDHPVLLWMERTRESLIQGVNLILAIETDRFFEISTELYGNSQTKLFKGETSNLEMARALASRMSTCNINDIQTELPKLSATEFSQKIEASLKERKPELPVRVEVTDQIAARVVAGMNRVRVRTDAHFSEMDLKALWNHEIESHCLTAQNGALQENCEFLSAGGPRTTMTQEGLAVFYEIHGHTMSQNRFLTLCNRIEASAKAEEGADFIETYRWFKQLTGNETEAFYHAQRVFRGAPLTGGKPFTKDVVYIAGLLSVYHFLRAAMKNQNRLLVESLVCGRIALEDVPTMAWLRVHGILKPPVYVPQWLENWDALLSYFSLSAVLGSIDLSNFQNYMDEYRSLEDWDLTL